MNYKDILNNINSEHFLSPNISNLTLLLQNIKSIISEAINHQGNLPVYETPDLKELSISDINEKEIEERNKWGIKEINQEVIKYLQGSVNVNHPLMLKNIIPLCSGIYLAVQSAVSIYMPNGVTGEDAGSVLMAELSTEKAISKLIGYNEKQSAGFFTFGGTGTNLYALKIAIEKVKAIKNDNTKVVILGSRSSHFCHQTCIYWLGLDKDSYIYVDSNSDQTTNLSKLAGELDKLFKKNITVSCIIGMAGTTSNMAMDDFEKLANIRDDFVKKYNLNYTPHIHADSVIGWAYCFFNDYDFTKNILGIPLEVINHLKNITHLTKKLKYADTIGIDFHKTGYMPYVSSMIIFKDQSNINYLRKNRNDTTPLFHNTGAYNPGLFTLETSRSSANMLATWVTLNAIGKEGFRSILSHNIEMALTLRGIIKQNLTSFVIINKYFFGSDIFLRCYPPSVKDVETEHLKELNETDTLNSNTNYINNFFKWLSSKENELSKKIAISKSSAAFYTSKNNPVVGLRIYLMNPYFNESNALEVCLLLNRLKEIFDTKK